MEKTELSFSRNVSLNCKNLIQDRMGIKAVESHSRYLGLSTCIGRSKKAIFSSLQDRLGKKISGWKEKFLSRAGKEVLLKSIAQAIPTYVMSCFKIPDSICQNLESMMSNFWWGNDVHSKNMHWINWQTLCRPKSKGGLGFRSLSQFNEALLGKQGWRLLQKPDSLVARVLGGRYFPHCSFMDATLGHLPSYTWRCIFQSRWILENGAYW